MQKTEAQHRDDIVRVGRFMYEKGWVASNDGNISIRLDENRILATPTSISKGMLRPEDLIITDLDGNKISGERERTSEMGMHLTIYRTRPDVNAVVHAHPPAATGFAVAGRALNVGILPEVIVSLGAVPLAAYGEPGTEALSDGMMPYLANYDALLLANHGAVAYGDCIDRAFCRMDTMEHSARITLVAELLGGPKVLPRVEIQKLFEARGRYGVKSHNRFEPGWPLAAEDMPDAEESRPATRNRSEMIELTREQLLAIIDDALRATRA
ncbi:MAG: class II aldolase/adducin family protein [Acidobacteriota bacterium]